MRVWERLQALPLGPFRPWVFARLLAWNVPYSASIGARVLSLEPGRARLELRERRAVQNHLGSVHAVALANLGELASGLALLTALPAGTRGIVTALQIDFHRKARGRIEAVAEVELPALPYPEAGIEHEVLALLRDASGASVASTRVRWRLGPAGAAH